jgi:hypothetical protein
LLRDRPTLRVLLRPPKKLTRAAPVVRIDSQATVTPLAAKRQDVSRTVIQTRPMTTRRSIGNLLAMVGPLVASLSPDSALKDGLQYLAMACRPESAEAREQDDGRVRADRARRPFIMTGWVESRRADVRLPRGVSLNVGYSRPCRRRHGHKRAETGLAIIIHQGQKTRNRLPCVQGLERVNHEYAH